MNNQKGISTVEIVMSVGFLAALVVVCLNIFKKQQAEMLNAIQEIEITSTVNAIRMTLASDEACTASLENKKLGSRDIKVIKRIIEYPATDEIEEVEAFPVFQYGRKTFGQYNLMISQFKIDEMEEDSTSGDEVPVSFKIEFDKGIPEIKEKNKVTREIKLYASTDELGRIETCSLNKKIIQESLFEERGSAVIRKSGQVSIGTKVSQSRLNIGGVLQLRPLPKSSCHLQDKGVLFFSKKESALIYCHFGNPFNLSNVVVEEL